MDLDDIKYKEYKLIYKYRNNHNKLKVSMNCLSLNAPEIKCIYDIDNLLKSLFYPMIMQMERNLKLLLLNMLINSNYRTANKVIASCLSSKCNHSNKQSLEQSIIRDVIINSHIFTKGEPKKKKQEQKKFILCEYDIARIIKLISFSTLTKLLYNLTGCYRKQLLLKINIIFPNTDLVHHCRLLKDLRNAIAHNRPIFDCRFRNRHRQISKYLIYRLRNTCGINSITFNSIIDYFVLIEFYQYHFHTNHHHIIREIYHFTHDLNICEMMLQNKNAFNEIFPHVPLNEFKTQKILFGIVHG